jgi:amino-acid N-acetyltransferase
MVNRFAAQNVMLPRSEENVCQTIEDWLVAVAVPEQRVAQPTTAHHRQSVLAFQQMATDTNSDGNDIRTAQEQSNAFARTYLDLDEQIVGCGALVPLTDKLVEVRSLAIHESQHGNGLGSTLVLKLVEMARDRGYAQLCALTLRPNFFIRLGFEQVDRWTISPKVWQACIYCPKFHRCDEVAVLMNLAAVPAEDEDERSRQPGWNRLLKWGEWQPLRLAYRYEYKESHRE